MSHPFICVDSGTQNYIEFNEAGEVVKISRLPAYSFDLWLLDDGTVLTPFYGDGSGFRRTDRDGKIVYEWKAEAPTNEIFGCQPMKDGSVVLGDLRRRALIKIDKNGREVSVTPMTYLSDNPHEFMRMPRLARDGKSFIVVQPGDKKVRRYSAEGTVLWEADTHADTFVAIEKPNGNVVYSCIEGIFELDPDGKEVWGVTPEEIPEIGFKWALGMQLLDNGNLVVCNWLGHGHDGEGVPMFEITPDKKIVWSFTPDPSVATNICNFQLLDVQNVHR